MESCSELPRAEYPLCRAVAADDSYCADAIYAFCGCVALQSPNTTSAVDETDLWERRQATVQLGFSSLSLLAGAAYLLLCLGHHLHRPAARTIRYPQTLALCMCACDLLKTASLWVVAMLRVRYVDPLAASAGAARPWISTSDAGCLCEVSTMHPGCWCENGILALLLQAGLVGSVSFFIALAHNFYRSIADPFMAPARRAPVYYVVCCAVTIAFSAGYLWPDAESSAFGGSGYRSDYLSCWFPERDGDALVNNVQAFVTVQSFVIAAWLAAIILYARAFRLLARGGGIHSSGVSGVLTASRCAQIEQSRVLVSVFFAYWMVTGLLYTLIYLVGSPPWGERVDMTCGSYMTALMSDAESHPHRPLRGRCLASYVLQAAFSSLLCIGGFLNAVTGLVANRALWGPGVSARRDKLAASDATTVADDATTVADDAVAPVELDISEALRDEIVATTVRGIRLTVSAHSGCSQAPLSSAEEGDAGSMRAPLVSMQARHPSPDKGEAGASSSLSQSVTLHGGGNFFPLREAFSDVATVELAPLDGERDAVVFREFAPRVSHWLRELEGVSQHEYVCSMGGSEGDADAATPRDRRFSEAKGGGFFFLSADGRYVVKTLDAGEHRALLGMLGAYCDHLRSHPCSLLARIAGIYSVSMYSQTKRFVVMGNIFPPASGAPVVSARYDLKGSWIDRCAPPESKTLKDSNWPAARTLALPPEARRALLRQAHCDARFLSSLGLMDYSLLLGELEASAPMFPYQMGIIDYLQRWDVRKRLERWAKIACFCRWGGHERSGMSAIAPHTYAQRFHRFVGCTLLGLTQEEVAADWEEPSVGAGSPRSAKVGLAAMAGGVDDSGRRGTAARSQGSDGPSRVERQNTL